MVNGKWKLVSAWISVYLQAEHLVESRNMSRRPIVILEAPATQSSVSK